MNTAVAETEKLISRLSRAEKAQILRWIVQDLGDVFPGIDHLADVAGNEACIVRTRIPVWVLEQARRLGAKESDLLQAYPSLRPTDLINAWAYVYSNQAEINKAISENEID